MARVFLCYASEDRKIAESVQVALANAGHVVFFDEQSLPPGGDYHKRIHNAIARCDAFVFLASTASLGAAKFTLTELDFVRKRWPSPADRVLPVLLGDLKPSDLPAYLAAATVLGVRGNTAAEVRSAVDGMLAHRLRWRRRALAGVAAGVILSTAAIVALNLRAPQVASSKDDVADMLDAPWTAMEGAIHFHSDSGDYIGGGEALVLADSNGIITAQVGDGSISIAFEGDDDWSLDFAAPRGEELTAGEYTGAQRTPFNNPLKPGLSVSGAGRGCNELDGGFSIRQIVISDERQLQLLDLEFEQRCDGDAAVLRGTLKLNRVAGS